MRALNSLLLLLIVGASGVGACAESTRTESGPGPLIPIDGGRKKDGATAPLVDGEAPLDGGADLDAATSDANVTANETGVDATTPTSPTADGTIGSNEYGVHTNGQNMGTSDVDAASPTTWHMTWDATNLYVAVSFADVNEAVVLYLDTAPMAGAPNGGSNADGSLTGYIYDATKLAPLPIRADFVAYVKASYNEVRQADGANSWSGPTASAVVQAGTGNVREIVIPWSTIRSAGRPSSFAWLGYATSSSGYVYGEMPPANPGGSLGLSGSFTHFYNVTDATPFTGTKPFANVLTP